eukprot:302582_1
MPPPIDGGGNIGSSGGGGEGRGHHQQSEDALHRSRGGKKTLPSLSRVRAQSHASSALWMRRFEQQSGKEPEGTFIDVVPRVPPLVLETNVGVIWGEGDVEEDENTGEKYRLEISDWDKLGVCEETGDGRVGGGEGSLEMESGSELCSEDKENETEEDEENVITKDKIEEVPTLENDTNALAQSCTVAYQRQTLSNGSADFRDNFVKKIGSCFIKGFVRVQYEEWDKQILWGDSPSPTSVTTRVQVEGERVQQNYIGDVHCRNPFLNSNGWLSRIEWDRTGHGEPNTDLLLSSVDKDIYFSVGRKVHRWPVLPETVSTYDISGNTDGGGTIHDDVDIQAKNQEDKRKRLALAAQSTGFTYDVGAVMKPIVQEGSQPVVIPKMPHAQFCMNKTAFRPPTLGDIKQYHRPRLPRMILEQDTCWIMQSPRKKLASQGQSTAVMMRGGVVLSQVRREKDLWLSDRGSFVMIEYCEERPPLLGNLGMCSRLITWWRPGPGMESPPPSADIQDGRLQELEPGDESPFLGDIPLGSAQQSIANELYRSPLFHHKTKGTDFLMVGSINAERGGRRPFSRTAVGDASHPDKCVLYSHNIREVEHLFLSGQTEPCKVVYVPGTAKAKQILSVFLAFLVGRLFEGSIGEIGVDLYKARDSWKNLGTIRDRDLRRAAKEIAVQHNTNSWFCRPDIDIHSYVERAAARFTPEDMCAYKSMLSTLRKLREAGIRELITADGLTNVLLLLKARQDRLQSLVSETKRRCEPQASSGSSNGNSPLEKLKDALETQLRALRGVRDVAQYIHEEVLLTPWNKTASFLGNSTGQGTGGRSSNSSMANRETLRLKGLGDPSGCGEGFSFLLKPPEDKIASKWEVPSDQLPPSKNIKGTSADLRKLNMRELLQQLVDLGMNREMASQLKRWDRVHMISVLANMAVISNTTEAASVRRFTRKHRRGAGWEMRTYRESCQEIWNRQARSLSLSENEILGFSAVTSPLDNDGDGGDEEDDDLLEDLDIEGEAGDEGSKKLEGKQRMADLVRPAPATALEAKERDEERALFEMRQQLASDNGKEQPPLIEENMKADVHAYCAMEEQKIFDELKHRLPERAVKEIRCIVRSDGSEIIRVRIILDPVHVADVARAEHERAASGLPSTLEASPLSTFLPDVTSARKALRLRREQMSSTHEDGEHKKIYLSRIKYQVKQHQDERKRKRLTSAREEAEQYRRPKKSSKSRSRGRGGAAQIQFSERLIAIVDILLTRNDSQAFAQPVHKKTYPAYYGVVKNPIDLGTIRSKAKNLSYPTIVSFNADIELMVKNALLFNGASHPITRASDLILEDAQQQIQNDNSLVELQNEAMASAAGKKIIGERKEINASSLNRQQIKKGGVIPLGGRKAVQSKKAGVANKPKKKHSSLPLTSKPKPVPNISFKPNYVSTPPTVAVGAAPSPVVEGGGGDTSSDSGEETVLDSGTASGI